MHALTEFILFFNQVKCKESAESITTHLFSSIAISLLATCNLTVPRWEQVADPPAPKAATPWAKESLH